jgi:hypothetical protein
MAFDESSFQSHRCRPSMVRQSAQPSESMRYGWMARVLWWNEKTGQVLDETP